MQTIYNRSEAAGVMVSTYLLGDLCFSNHRSTGDRYFWRPICNGNLNLVDGQ